jgi:nucleolar protein 56
MAPTHILFESSSGYSLFQVKQYDQVASMTKEVQQDTFNDLHKFGKLMQLKSFSAFKNAAHALENANDVSEGVMNDHLRSFLELNLPKSSSKGVPIILGVSDKNLAGSITTSLGIACETSDSALDLIRAVRLHAEKLHTGFQSGDITKAQLGLGHSYSRAKVKFNVNRSDNMIIQAIALLDQLDKDVNTFGMRLREWYGWSFPELAKIVPDNMQFAQAALFIGAKESLDESKLPELTEILDSNETTAKNVLDAARASMGSAPSEFDLINISSFAQRVVSLSEYRKNLIAYLTEKMNLVAPSLTALIGERIGARLISHAGSLTNLSKYPASTVQILGAEKALFRALKTKGNTPKYGLIYHSSFIGRAGPKHKGRISRFLANKCSIASRIDCFSDTPNPKYGEALRGQVEERLNFFATGDPPSKNSEVMQKVLGELAMLGMMDEDDEDSDEEMEDAKPAKKEKKDKKGTKEKKKKRKSDAMDVDEEDEPKAPKLSKEERKAARKAARKEAKKAEKVVSLKVDEMKLDSPKPSKKSKKPKMDEGGDESGQTQPTIKKKKSSKILS